jgi:hypothetical protein
MYKTNKQTNKQTNRPRRKNGLKEGKERMKAERCTRRNSFQLRSMHPIAGFQKDLFVSQLLQLRTSLLLLLPPFTLTFPFLFFSSQAHRKQTNNQTDKQKPTLAGAAYSRFWFLHACAP